MRRIFDWAILLAAAILAAPVAAGVAPSEIVSPAQPGFVVAHEAASATQSIREEIPAGDTLEDWSRMVTSQSFRVPAELTPERMAENMIAGLFASCPDAATSEVISERRDGRRAVRFDVECPLLPSTGKPESFWLLAIRDGDFLHVKQAAIRMPRTPELEAWAVSLIEASKLQTAR